MAATQQRFHARLERDTHTLGWTIAAVPFEPSKVWKKMLRLRVRGTVNGFAFRTSLFPARDGGFFLLVNRAMQSGAGITHGDTAAFQLEPDLDPREAELPDELAVLLDDEPGLRTWYDSLTEYTRREIGKWVAAVKSDAARLRRATQMAERLLATMEAERELPPAIAAAFRARPRASTGWQRMPPSHRRAELMAVFHYQSIEARQRRIDKLCDAAEERSS
jgi:uncharacterized protein YdeI (YjbR/CyaY-like superfamily)